MRRLPFILLLFILPISLAAPKGPYRRTCFSSSVKPIDMKHVDSTNAKWRTSPRNYQEAMKELKSKRINAVNVTKSDKRNSWIPDREVIVQLILCEDSHSNCCVVENYDRVNYRIYKCGGTKECGETTKRTFPSRDGHSFSTLSDTDNNTMLCSGAWNSPCQYRGHPH